MKKFIRLWIVMTLVAAFLATGVSAIMVDETKGIQYFLFGSFDSMEEAASKENPHNQMKLAFETIDGGGGMEMSFDGSSGAYGPYFSFDEVELGEYRYAKMRYYYKSVEGAPESSMTLQYYFQGGRCSYKFTMEKDKWTDVVISFKKGAEGFSGKEWAADATAKQFRLQLGLSTNSSEPIYVSYIAFFKTQEEAETFHGFINVAEYNSYVYGYEALIKDRYQNTEAVKEFIDTHSVDQYLYADQQAEVDALTAQLRELYNAMEWKTGPMPEQYKPASHTLTVLDVKTYDGSNPGEIPTAGTNSPSETEPAAEEETPPSTEPSEDSGNGIGGIVVGVLAGVIVAVVGIVIAQKKKKA